jgi:hypothetical protein
VRDDVTIGIKLSSFRGARKRELGCAIAHRRIHGSAEFVAKWIPGLSLSAHPGMTQA